MEIIQKWNKNAIIVSSWQALGTVFMVLSYFTNTSVVGGVDYGWLYYVAGAWLFIGLFASIFVGIKMLWFIKDAGNPDLAMMSGMMVMLSLPFVGLFFAVRYYLSEKTASKEILNKANPLPRAERKRRNEAEERAKEIKLTKRNEEIERFDNYWKEKDLKKQQKKEAKNSRKK